MRLPWGLEILSTGEQPRHHTCLLENKPRVVQTPVVLFALAHPFNFAVFPDSATSVLGALTGDE